jgi:hypothetical protein
MTSNGLHVAECRLLQAQCDAVSRRDFGDGQLLSLHPMFILEWSNDSSVATS